MPQNDKFTTLETCFLFIPAMMQKELPCIRKLFKFRSTFYSVFSAVFVDVCKFVNIKIYFLLTIKISSTRNDVNYNDDIYVCMVMLTKTIHVNDYRSPMLSLKASTC